MPLYIFGTFLLLSIFPACLIAAAAGGCHYCELPVLQAGSIAACHYCGLPLLHAVNIVHWQHFVFETLQDPNIVPNFR